jgi:hypothetical protein
VNIPDVLSVWKGGEPLRKKVAMKKRRETHMEFVTPNNEETRAGRGRRSIDINNVFGNERHG